jgi:cytoskeletal protein RodZ
MMSQHEKSDMDPRYALYFAAALAVVVAAIHVGLWWMFYRFEEQQARRQSRPPQVETEKAKPEPGLQISPQGDLEEMRRRENKILSTYGWIDQDSGTARIPIERAMQLFLERQKK